MEFLRDSGEQADEAGRGKKGAAPQEGGRLGSRPGIFHYLLGMAQQGNVSTQRSQFEQTADPDYAWAASLGGALSRSTNHRGGRFGADEEVSGRQRSARSFNKESGE